jgi:arylsulfatase A-like enzyme
MLHAMDRAIGRVLDALGEHGLEERTLVFFLGDNGGPPRANGSRNDPLRGGKGTEYEGGIRVPFALQWKGTLPAGTTYESPVVSLDIFATAAAAAGAGAPTDRALDGVDLLPFVLGRREGRPHDTLCWRSGERFAVRVGDFKLVRPTRRDAALELYDLGRDTGEAHDLAGEQPDKVRELRAVFERWAAETVEPRWPAPVRNRRRAGR